MKSIVPFEITDEMLEETWKKAKEELLSYGYDPEEIIQKATLVLERWTNDPFMGEIPIECCCFDEGED